MGVYDYTVVNTPYGESEACATNLVNYLNTLDGIVATLGTREAESTTFVGANFNIYGTNITGFFGWKETDQRRPMCCLYNGETALIEPYLPGSDYSSKTELPVYSYTSDDCTLISMKQKIGLEFLFVKATNGSNLIGYASLSSASAAFIDISSLVYEDANDLLRLHYSYANMFPYAANSGTLDFLAQAYFVNSGVRRYTSKVLKECSTVILLSTVSLPTPLNNHLAIGAHCIVPLDNQGGN